MSEPISAQRRDQIASAAIGLALLVYGTLAASAYDLRLLALAGCYAIAVIGYQRLFGDLGLLSLAQGAFFAVGAYAVALLSGDLVLGLPLAMIVAGALALFCTLILLRLGSHYLALASLAVGMLVLLAAVNLDRLTGGANGLSVTSSLDNAGLALLAGGGVIVAALAYWFSNSGLQMLRRQLLRELPRAAAATGMRAVAWQRSGFVFAAMLAALGGALYAPTAGVISPQTAELGLMVNLLAATVIGGRGKVAGALIGALLLVLVPELLRFAGNWYLFLWGLALLVMLIAAPGGIAGAIDRLRLVKPRWTIKSSTIRDANAPANLRLENLCKSFGGVVAVDNVSLGLLGGEALAVIGPNGAGKTTLLNLIAGNEHADAGRILWREIDIADLPVSIRAGLGIGRTFQTSELPAGQSLIDAVACGTAEHIDLAQARGRAMTLLEELGIADHAFIACEQLAPPIRRLAEIARALVARPALLILDEPTAGMNQAERAHLAQALSRWRATGLALFIVEHDIDFVAAIAGRLACMEAGRIVAQGAPQELRADPALRRFFGAAAL